MLTQEEKIIAQQLKKEGYQTGEIISHIGAKRLKSSSSIDQKRLDDLNEREQLSLEQTKKEQSRLSDIPSDIAETGTALKETGEAFNQDIAGINERVASGETGFGESLGQKVASGVRAAGRGFGDLFIGGLKLFTTPEQEPQAQKMFADIAEKSIQDPILGRLVSNAGEIMNQIKEKDPNTYESMRSLLTVGAGAAEVAGYAPAKRGFSAGFRTLDTGVESTSRRFKSLITRPTKSIDDVVMQADEAITTQVRQLAELPETATPAQIRAFAEQNQIPMNLKEKMIGLTPDVKKQISGKPEKMAEYIDVVNARNLDATAPTVMEWGGNEARNATEEMSKLLKESGSEIGAVRTRYATMRAAQDSVQAIESKMMQSLDELGLKIQITDKGATVVQKSGRVSRLAGKGDLKAIQDIYNQFRIVKQNPTLENLVDFRNFNDRLINFEKSAREISNSVDPFAKGIRFETKDAMNAIVGKTGAKELDNYSNFISAYDDIKSFTDRRAGGEYLLRLTLSGRGGEARQIIQTIKQYTGIDLLDDAVMMTVVTDMLANPAQKDLFRQELTKAGIDAARILSGDPRGAIPFIGKFVQDKFLDQEKILKEASGFKQGAY